jgi:hypothetical protein
MMALLDLLETVLHIGSAIRWLFSRSYRKKVRDEATWPDVAIGLILLAILTGALVYALALW